ncbi:MAG: hypothetical protein WKG00_00295 [Polyangiaceae bacterium]
MSDRTIVKTERLGGVDSLRAWSSAALVAAVLGGASTARAQDKLPSGPNPYAEPAPAEPPGAEPVQGADGSVSATASLGGAPFPGDAPTRSRSRRTTARTVCPRP